MERTCSQSPGVISCRVHSKAILNFHGLWLRAHDAEFAHPVVESGAVEAETRGGSGWTTNDPFGIVEHFEDVIALDVLQLHAAVVIGRSSRRLFQLGQRDLE